MIEIRLDSGAISVTIALALFGVLYNQFVGWAIRKGYAEGYMSLIVAFGVFVTLIGVAMINIEAAILTLIAFAASGTPMIVGSIVRYVRTREEARKAIIDDTTT